jgi:hypothetical protein
MSRRGDGFRFASTDSHFISLMLQEYDCQSSPVCRIDPTRTFWQLQLDADTLAAVAQGGRTMRLCTLHRCGHGIVAACDANQHQWHEQDTQG